MPHFPCEFEIPDDWIAAAGMAGFVPPAAAYRSAATATVIPLVAIEPPPRFISSPKDWKGFDRARLLSVLTGFVDNAEIEPVPVIELPKLDRGHSPYSYRVLNGVHRYYGSIIAGFSNLPVEIA